MNQITLIGNVGRSPELAYAPSGTAIAKFTLATNYKRQDEQETTWHNIIAFGKQAELLNQYVGKGSKLLVQGRLTKRPYTSQDGSKREWVEVVVEKFEFLTTVRPEDQEASDAASTEDESQIPF